MDETDRQLVHHPDEHGLIHLPSAEYRMDDALQRRAVGAFTVIAVLTLLAAVALGEVMMVVLGGCAFAGAVATRLSRHRTRQLVEFLHDEGTRVAGRVVSTTYSSDAVSVRYRFRTHDREWFDDVASLAVALDDVKGLSPIVAYDPEDPEQRHMIVAWLSSRDQSVRRAAPHRS